MSIVIVSFVLMVIVVLLMSVGVLMGRKPVQGSCGGLNNIEGMVECEICGGEPTQCEQVNK